jgi:hypothetical protein
MSAKAKVLIGLLVAVLLVSPVLVGESAALPTFPIPNYFHGEFSALFCTLTAVPNVGVTAALAGLNFDGSTGISLSQAEALYQQLLQGVGALAPLIGQNFQLACALSPVQTNSLGYDAFTIAQILSPSFKSFGYSTYIIFDLFLFTAPDFLGGFSVVRIDVFQVLGNNNLAYLASVEFPSELLFPPI